jgi:hypothetical protein
LAAPGQREFVCSGQALSFSDTDLNSYSPSLKRIIEVWPDLLPHIRDAIGTLVDASYVTSQFTGTKSKQHLNE